MNEDIWAWNRKEFFKEVKQNFLGGWLEKSRDVTLAVMMVEWKHKDPHSVKHCCKPIDHEMFSNSKSAIDNVE